MIEQHLPHALRALGPGGLAWWQWIAIPLMVVLALLLGALLGWVTRRILGHLAARTETTWDDELLERLSAPITLLWTFALATLAEPILDLGPGAGFASASSSRITSPPATRGTLRPGNIVSSSRGSIPSK